MKRLPPALQLAFTTVAVIVLGGAEPADRKPLTFEVTYAPAIGQGPISARVYVMLGPGSPQAREPRTGPDWFNPSPFFAVDAKDWKPGEPLRFGPDLVGYPGALKSIKPGKYRAQAIVRLNVDTHSLGEGEGNAYGPAIPVALDTEHAGTVALKVDKLVPPKPFRETERIKLVDIPSPLLSAFYHRPMRQRAAVVLPDGDRSAQRATLYIIPGFGGDHHQVTDYLRSPAFNFGRDMIRVMLDPDCGTGHHVFADSACNGPRGRALIEELIPHIERTYPAIPESWARLLNGHSSGGWSSLWLQVTYPDFFGGTWSTSPDPVDFRDFQLIDLYAPGENMFRDRQGKRRPIARSGRTPVLFYDNFSKLDDVIGDGGQLHSFEAVFSPLNPEGAPRRLWNRSTGAVDGLVAKTWEAYDIRLILERNWKTLGPKLAGKLHIVTGELDTFYLDGATRLLKQSLEALGSDATVEIIPGKDHGTVLSPELARRIDGEMKATLKKNRPAGRE